MRCYRCKWTICGEVAESHSFRADGPCRKRKWRWNKKKKDGGTRRILFLQSQNAKKKMNLCFCFREWTALMEASYRGTFWMWSINCWTAKEIDVINNVQGRGVTWNCLILSHFHFQHSLSPMFFYGKKNLSCVCQHPHKKKSVSVCQHPTKKISRCLSTPHPPKLIFIYL